MAHFIYNGEPPRPNWVTTYGPCDAIQLPAVGGRVQYDGPFTIGQDMGIDFTDPDTLTALRSDTRFTEI